MQETGYTPASMPAVLPRQAHLHFGVCKHASQQRALPRACTLFCSCRGTWADRGHEGLWLWPEYRQLYPARSQAQSQVEGAALHPIGGVSQPACSHLSKGSCRQAYLCAASPWLRPGCRFWNLQDNSAEEALRSILGFCLSSAPGIPILTRLSARRARLLAAGARLSRGRHCILSPQRRELGSWPWDPEVSAERRSRALGHHGTREQVQDGAGPSDWGARVLRSLTHCTAVQQTEFHPLQ